MVWDLKQVCGIRGIESADNQDKIQTKFRGLFRHFVDGILSLLNDREEGEMLETTVNI